MTAENVIGTNIPQRLDRLPWSRWHLAMVIALGITWLLDAVFFTYGLVLSRFFHVKNTRVPLYLLPLALGNFAGPLLLGRYFDTIGRRKMIAATYGTSGLLLIGSAVMFRGGRLTPVTQDVWFVGIFFVDPRRPVRPI